MSSSKAKLPGMELCAALDVSRGPTNASWKNLIHAPSRHDVLYLAFKRYKITSGFGQEPCTSCHLLSRLLSRSLLQILSPPRIDPTYLWTVVNIRISSWIRLVLKVTETMKHLPSIHVAPIYVCDIKIEEGHSKIRLFG